MKFVLLAIFLFSFNAYSYESSIRPHQIKCGSYIMTGHFEDGQLLLYKGFVPDKLSKLAYRVKVKFAKDYMQTTEHHGLVTVFADIHRLPRNPRKPIKIEVQSLEDPIANQYVKDPVKLIEEKECK
jgi:hypothetical protein